MPLRYIACGLPKTGTMSLQKAFNMLGLQFDHFFENYTKRGDLWLQVMQTKDRDKRVELLRGRFEDCDAVGDFPASFYFEELALAYPGAKLILTTRDLTSWLQSVKAQTDLLRKLQWLGYIPGPPRRVFEYFMYMETINCPEGTRDTPAPVRNSWLPHNDSFMRWWYEEHHRGVLALNHSGRVLRFSVREGWSPLCTFLSVPVPAVAFPASNKRDDQSVMIIQQFSRCGWFRMLVLTVAILCIAIIWGVVLS
jgi:hypothetical protein